MVEKYSQVAEKIREAKNENPPTFDSLGTKKGPFWNGTSV